jgi:hypothetical protein
VQTVEDNRRKNLEVLIAQWGTAVQLASALGHSGSSYLGHLISKRKPFTERTARQFEQKLALPPLWMDKQHAGVAAQVDFDPVLLEKVVRAVTDTAKGYAVNSSKLSAIVVEVYTRASQDGQVDVAQMRRLFELAK